MAAVIMLQVSIWARGRVTQTHSSIRSTLPSSTAPDALGMASTTSLPPTPIDCAAASTRSANSTVLDGRECTSTTLMQHRRRHLSSRAPRGWCCVRRWQRHHRYPFLAHHACTAYQPALLSLPLNHSIPAHSGRRRGGHITLPVHLQPPRSCSSGRCRRRLPAAEEQRLHAPRPPAQLLNCFPKTCSELLAAAAALLTAAYSGAGHTPQI